MNKKTLLTLGALAPLIYTLSAIIYQVYMISSIYDINTEADIINRMASMMNVLYLSAILLMIIIVILKVYFIGHVSTNRELNNNEPIIWMVLLFIFNTIPMYIYMYKYIYNKPWRDQLSLDHHKEGSKVLWTGIVALLPYVFVILVLVFAGSMFSGMMEINNPGSMSEVMAVFIPMFAAEGLMILTMLLAMIIFITLVVKNESLSSGQRIAWIVLMIVQSSIAVIVYWFIYVFRKEDMAMEGSLSLDEDL